MSQKHPTFSVLTTRTRGESKEIAWNEISIKSLIKLFIGIPFFVTYTFAMTPQVATPRSKPSPVLRSSVQLPGWGQLGATSTATWRPLASSACVTYVVSMLSIWHEDEDVFWDVHPQQEVVCRNKATKKQWKGEWYYIDVHPFSDLDDLAIWVLCFRNVSEYFGTIGWPAAWVLSACEY